MIVDKHLGEVDELVTNLFSLRKNAIVFRLFAMALQDQDVKKSYCLYSFVCISSQSRILLNLRRE